MPALARFPPEQKRIVWINFVSGGIGKKKRSRVCALILVMGLVVGFGIGLSCRINSLITAAAGLMISAGIAYLYNLAASEKPLREYVESSDFSLQPMNEVAARLIAKYQRR